MYTNSRLTKGCQTMHSHLRKSWSRVSHNPVWAGVIGTVIAAAVIGIVDTADTFLTKKSPLAPVERAEIRGGAWGPSRLLYRCMPNGNCIAPDHVVFDSISNDPHVGNEAYFMGAKILGRPGSMQDRVRVKVGDTVLIRSLIENDAAMNVPGRQSLVAQGTRFSLRIPINSSSELPVIGVISAANAAPQHIDDGVFLFSKKRFSIEYDWGSAVLAHRRHEELPLSNDIVGEGALVGSGRPNGTFSPGLSNIAAVFLLVHINPPAA
jgi:hypothetical protein